MKKTVTAEQYRAIWDQMCLALGADKATVYEVAFGPTGAVVRNVKYTRQDNGTMSGDFWEDEVTMKGEAR